MLCTNRDRTQAGRTSSLYGPMSPDWAAELALLALAPTVAAGAAVIGPNTASAVITVRRGIDAAITCSLA